MWDKTVCRRVSKVWVGNIDDNVEKLLKARFINKFDENCPKDAMHVYTENEPVKKRNDAILNDLSGEFYTIDKIPDKCKYSLATIQAAQNQKQTNKHRKFSKVA